ncbi:MAG: TetR/AcrR family transcriptional regulator [Dehalococcoidia bacterium]
MVMHGAPERADARANRRRVLDAALEVIAERGAGAEIKEVAERAGVGVGTIYRNFATRDDLFRGVIGEMLERFFAVRDEALAVEDPIDSITFYVHKMFGILEKWSPAIMAIMSGAFTEEIKERFLEFARDRRLESIFYRGIALGVFRRDLPVELARGFLVNACDPVVYMAVKDSASLEEIASGYTDLVLRAFRADPASPG